MLTTATRPYTDAEFDDYNGRMVTAHSCSITVIVLLGVIGGGMAMLCTFAVHWLYAWLTSGSVTWMLSLIVGAAVAAVTIVVLWLGSSGDDWTEHPPELATDVTATAYAAWHAEDDGLDTVLVLRVEADQYLLLTQNALTPPLLHEHPPGTPADTIPSGVGLVLMGEGAFRIAMNVSLSGLAIPLARVDAAAAEGDPDRDDETPIADGLYTTAELPGRIRVAIGVA